MKQLFLIITLLSIIGSADCKSLTVTNAKLSPNNTQIKIDAATVTCVFGDGFYVITSESPVGILVTPSPSNLAASTLVQIEGVVATNMSGEKYVQASKVNITGSQSNILPVVTGSRALLSSDFEYEPLQGSGQRGVYQGANLNVTGLYVRTTGKITSSDYVNSRAYLDDGGLDRNYNNAIAGNPAGLRLNFTQGAYIPQPNSVVALSGVISLFFENGRYYPVLRVSSQPDSLITIKPAFESKFYPAGLFQKGNSATGYDLFEGMPREYPAHSVYVGGFWLSKCEITRGEYRQFINDGGYNNQSLWSNAGWAWKQSVSRTQPDFWDPVQNWFQSDLLNTQKPFTQSEQHPVVGVTFFEVEAFCNWAGVRLPTEAEWEKASRYTTGGSRVYPYGNIWIAERSNNWQDSVTPGWSTSKAGVYPLGASVDGLLDLTGNLWEWTSSWYQSHPGAVLFFDRTGQQRTVKGGSWYGVYGARPAARLGMTPTSSRRDLGFRVCY